MNILIIKPSAQLSSILITGGAGYVGSHIAFELTQQGNQVIILDRLQHGQSWPHAWGIFIEGDCADTHLLQSIFLKYPISTVIHCAASIEVSESIAYPIHYYLNNVAVTLNLLQLMAHYHIPQIIFSSSCSVYGTPHDIAMSESHPIAPLSPYGTSKRMGEQIIQDAARAHQLSYVILRYFNAAGANAEYALGERHKPETHVIPRLIEACYVRQPFTLFGADYNTPDGTCLRDYTHVIDIARAHVYALNYLQAQGPSDIFNIGSGKGISVRQLISAVEQVVGAKLIIKAAPRRMGDSPVLIANIQKAKELLHWQPEHSELHMMIESAAAFMRSKEYKEFARVQECA